MTEEVRADSLTRAIAARFAATFDRELSEQTAPQGIHWCLWTPETSSAELGIDGHPADGGGFLPKSDLPRRMWASSSVDFLSPLVLDESVVRHSRVVDATEKVGSSGRLMFVTVSHEISSGNVIAIRETQTIVYREAVHAFAGAPRTAASFQTGHNLAGSWSWQRTIKPTAPLLFRYSALTFNSHRIHYDQTYARDVEGYPDLLVHGPLMATLLLDMCDRELGSNVLSNFSFRAQSPAYVDEPLLLVGKPGEGAIELAVLGCGGRTVMSAKAKSNGG